MKKTLGSLLAAATIAVVVAGTATDASAQYRRGGGAVAAGIAAGVVGGLIVGSAIANSRPAYVVAPGPGYVAYPAYAAACRARTATGRACRSMTASATCVGWRGRPVAVCQ